MQISACAMLLVCYTNLVKMYSLSKSLYQLSVLCVFLVDSGKLVSFLESQEECTSHIQFVLIINAVVCQYQWNCTAPDHNGQRYIPNERDSDAPTSITDGGSLHIYRVPTLNPSCYGQVTAIEYCYEYRTTAGSGQATFNWTVLILEDTARNEFVIDSIYFIISSLSVTSVNCTNDGQLRTCCDRNNIEEFDLPMSNFAFGVTESAQGNTLGARLLGFADALPQYRVDAQVLNRADVTLSVGSTIGSRSPVPRGIRVLWFVIGKYQYSNILTMILSILL